MTGGGWMTGGCWVAHPASNITATISDRNFTLHSLAPLIPCARRPYEDQRHHRMVWTLVKLFSGLTPGNKPDDNPDY
jgi:hypothetical protein